MSLKNNLDYEKILLDEKNNPRAKMHSFHRYYGKLIPAIPAAFIKEFSHIGDLIFDPFTGSGTTAVEAKINGRNFVGCEINPISRDISYIKTRNLKSSILNEMNDELIKLINNNDYEFNNEDLPYLLNRDHWFKSYVQKDLCMIKYVVKNYFNNLNNPLFNNIENISDYELFYIMNMSAILKNVSNCDTRHVFPGISKRIRALEEAGKNEKDVISSYIRSIKKRSQYYDEYTYDTESEIINKNIMDLDVTELKNKVDLIVTNPPYISSVRYIETMKLEMFWFEYLKNAEEYDVLAHAMFGNDKLRKNEYSNLEYTNFSEINKIIDNMALIDLKSAKIIGTFFNNIEVVIRKMAFILKQFGRVVIKISDSKIKKVKIETGNLMNLIAKKYGFQLEDVFLDEINNNSRSLSTARNTYSDIITHDYIIIWKKIHE